MSVASQSIIPEIREALARLEAKTDVNHQMLLMVVHDRLKDRHMLAADHQRLKAVETQLELVSQKSDIPDWEPELATLPGVPSPIRPPSPSGQDLERVLEFEERFKEEEKRRRESIIWWKRQRWIWGMAAIGFLFATIFTGCAVYVTDRVKSLEKKIDQQNTELHRSTSSR